MSLWIVNQTNAILVLQGHCPLAKGKLLTEESVVKISKEIGRTPAQVLIRWSIQNGVIAIPKSTKRERLAENYQVRPISVTPPPLYCVSPLF